MKIRWLRTALNNLNREAEYIAEESPRTAELILRRIEKAVSLLAKQPSLGRPGRVYGTRELVVPKTRYIIPYRVKNNYVEILRVFHTSRKLPEHW